MAKLIKLLTLIIPFVFFACNPQPAPQQNAEITQESDQELEKQSDEFSKSMDNLDEAMNAANELNQRIQLVEKRFKDGDISREHADELIQSLNKRFGQNPESETDETIQYIFPQWLANLGISEPNGLSFDGDNSFQTKEHSIQDGYNSVLFVYHGSYNQSMKEADRIANAAGIPLTEAYRKARDLSKRLGKNFEGLKGVIYMNYEIGATTFNQPYKISINVDDKGKFTLNVVDIKAKADREKSGSTPVKY